MRIEKALAGRVSVGVQQFGGRWFLQKFLHPGCGWFELQRRKHLDSDVFVLPALSGQQNHESSLLEPGFYRAASGKRLQFPLGALIQFNLSNSH